MLLQLKAELMMHDALAERGGVSYDEFTDEQRNEIARMVQVRAHPRHQRCKHRR